jgi:exopolysaccharide production protein ExoY
MAQQQAVLASELAEPSALLGTAEYLVDKVASPLARSFARRAIKRVVDLVGGVSTITIALPLMLLIALAIVVDSRGSPVYVHRRIGRDGVAFGVMKFRSMVRGADDGWDEQLTRDPERAQDWERARKVRDDPRVTRVGRLLRKYSLDELPQLLNVVAGHMSLVGPRPVMEDELEFFGDEAPLVLSVRPGVTGLWTISGRSDTSYEERVALEASYVREWRLQLDLSILMRTVPRVISGRGAY